MLRYFLFSFCVLSGVCGIFTEDERSEMQKMISPVAEKCMNEFGMSKEDFDALKKSHNPANIDPCFTACMMKGGGLIDDEGMVDGKALTAFFTKFVKDDEKLNILLEIGKQCMAVNQEEVTDGAKGCERAFLVSECFMKHKDAILDMS